MKKNDRRHKEYLREKKQMEIGGIIWAKMHEHYLKTNNFEQSVALGDAIIEDLCKGDPQNEKMYRRAGEKVAQALKGSLIRQKIYGDSIVNET